MIVCLIGIELDDTPLMWLII